LNPQSSPQGVEQNIWAVSLNGGAPRKLGEGHSPAMSPKGGTVAFLFKTQVWLAKLEGSEKPEQLIHANGSLGGLRWSPDGSKLAFTSRRGDHGFIGVFDVTTKSPWRKAIFPSAHAAKDSPGPFESPTLPQVRARSFGTPMQVAEASSTKWSRRIN
jgi:Tol biopolymer transport system component